jgi:DNA-binding transcriptional regulator GbsR (MarR family)
MTEDEAAFVEAMGHFMGAYGMTPVAGRLWAWLLICDPPARTAADLASDLKASRGAISGAAASLTSAGMIRRVGRRGDRREYFSAPPGTFDALLHSAGGAYGRLLAITTEGLATVGGPEGRRERLQEVHDAVAFVARELPILVERYLVERSSAVTGPVPARRPSVEAHPAIQEIPT